MTDRDGQLGDLPLVRVLARIAIAIAARELVADQTTALEERTPDRAHRPGDAIAVRPVVPGPIAALGRSDAADPTRTAIAVLSGSSS